MHDSITITILHITLLCQHDSTAGCWKGFYHTKGLRKVGARVGASIRVSVSVSIGVRVEEKNQKKSK